MTDEHDAGRPAFPEGQAEEEIVAEVEPELAGDEGWEDAPEGHREGRKADDDLIRRKG